MHESGGALHNGDIGTNVWVQIRRRSFKNISNYYFDRSIYFQNNMSFAAINTFCGQVVNPLLQCV